jgi:hypothetical protein
MIQIIFEGSDGVSLKCEYEGMKFWVHKLTLAITQADDWKVALTLLADGLATCKTYRHLYGHSTYFLKSLPTKGD